MPLCGQEKICTLDRGTQKIRVILFWGSNDYGQRGIRLIKTALRFKDKGVAVRNITREIKSIFSRRIDC